MAQISFDEMFATATRFGPRDREPEPRTGHWYASWEEWLTFILVVFVQLPVIGSLQSADWVSEMPSLLAAAFVGLVAGWLLAQSRLPGLPAASLGLALGSVTVIAMVMQTMRLADPLLGTGLGVHWSEFWLRLRDWWGALLEGGISTDPLPFVVLLVAAVFAVSFLTAWAVVRWRNPWAALVPGGFVLLTNISYLPGQPSFSFIVYLVAGILLVTRLHFIQAVLRWKRHRVEPPDFMSVEVLSVAAAIGLFLVLFAWLIPTANNWGPVSDAWQRALSPVTHKVDQFGQLFVGVGSKKGIPVHNLGATLPLQGKVTLDETPILEVDAPEELNLRGAVYDEYTGNGWKVSAATSEPLLGTTIDAAEFGTPETRAQVRMPVTIEVTVVGNGAPAHRMLSAGDPIAADPEADLLLGRGGPIGLVPNDDLKKGSQYTTVGAVSAASIATLQSAGTDYPPGLFQTYTQLPADLPPEVAALARSVAGDAATPYEAARRFEAYLRQNYTFTLDVPPPAPRRDAVAYFLFDQPEGYFDQFASAMVVMLRTLGIPSRLAVGFALDGSQYDSETKHYMVSERAAWTWPEVYFPTLGWIEFNPTPARGLVARPGDDSAALADAAAARGNTDDLDLLLEELLLAEVDTGAPGALQDFQADTPFIVGSQAFAALVRVLTWVLLISAVGFVGLLVARFFWERSFRGLTPPARRWAKVTRLAAWAGLLPAAHRTPIEVADDLGVALGEPSAMRHLARAYVLARYSRDKDVEESEDEARLHDQQYGRVRRRLVRQIVRRVRRFGATSQPVSALAGRHPVAGARR